MAVAFSASSSTGVSGTDTVDNRSIAGVTTSGTDRFIAVGVSVRNNPGIHISSISRGSDTYTEHAFIEGDSPSTIRVNAAQGVSTNEPQTASATLTVTLASATGGWGFSYHSFTGVDQTTRVDTAQTNEGSGTSSAISTTSETDDMVIDVLAIRDGSHSAAVNGAQSGTDWLFEQTNITGGGSHAAGATSVNMSWSWTTSDEFAHIATNINAAATATSYSSMLLTGVGA